MQALALGADEGANASQGRWSRANPDVRKAVVREVYVARASTEYIAALIDKVRKGGLLSPEPRCVLITGSTGAGKSWFLRHYISQSPQWRDSSGCLIQPLIHVEFDSFVTVVGAAKLLLRKLEDPSFGSGKLDELTHRVRHQIVKQRVEAVLIDEFQHIVDTGTRTINKVGDWIKQLSKSTNVPFIMAGMPEAARIVDGNVQFAGITPYRHTLGMFGFEKNGERRVFRVFLAQIDEKLPFDHVAGLADIATAKVLFETTQGNLRTLMHLIQEAAGHAIDRNAAVISMPDLAYGYEQVEALSPLQENPFSARGIMLPDHPGSEAVA